MPADKTAVFIYKINNMAKTKEQKKKILEKLSDKINRAKSIVFTNFDALGVQDNEELRIKLKAENSEYYVAKKTLFNLAFQDKNIKDFDIKSFKGRISAIFGYGDEIVPAKIVNDFKKDHEEKINFVGGILEGKFLSSEKITTLSKLPSKQELYAKIVGSINAPISGFVNALAGNLRNLVYVLKAVEEKKK